MPTVTVVVADDQHEIATAMQGRVEEAAAGALASIVVLSDSDLEAAVSDLLHREEQISQHPGWSPAAYDTICDQADILVLDYDMTDLFGGQGYMTGEQVASLARRYSRAGAIVSVNRFGSPRFNLGLQDDDEPWADLSLAHEDLAIAGLWQRTWEGEYRPWYWPILSDFPELFRKRVRFVENHWDQPIAEALRMPNVVVKTMPTTIADHLIDPANLTFQQLVEEHILPPKPTSHPSKRQMARAGAAEVGRWLASIVLPGQGLFIDAPHLATQFPSMVTKSTSLENLNQLALGRTISDLPLDHEAVENARFAFGYWLDRPVWWTPLVLENSDLIENRQPWKRDDLGAVFCEDTSTFENPDNCTRFRAEGFIKRRYVRRSQSMAKYATYYPVNRLLD